ncbi:MAG: spore germination protein [Chloroflexaceae bacterium]|nr:spore germination protein [Chloroflexaceae bacterium]
MAAGAGAAWWAVNSLDASSPSSPQPTATAPAAVQPEPQPETTAPSAETPQAAAQAEVELYWVQDRDGAIALVPDTLVLQKSDSPASLLEAAFTELLSGPDNQGVASSIPAGTKLLGIEMGKDGVHVNLSEEYTSGGGSASMMSRLGQVVYTATTLDPDAQVWLEVGGEPLEVLGGEGLLVEQPLTRKSFDRDFPL